MQPESLSITLEVCLNNNPGDEIKPRSLPIKDYRKVMWSSKEQIQKSIRNVSTYVLKELEQKYGAYNRDRAVQYARHFLRERSRGHGANPVAFTYEFADVEHLINTFPILEAGRSEVLEPPVVFGPAGAIEGLENREETT